jgi:hypothetical protein
VSKAKFGCWWGTASSEQQGKKEQTPDTWGGRPLTQSDAESAQCRRSLRNEAACTRLTACEARWVHVSKAKFGCWWGTASSEQQGKKEQTPDTWGGRPLTQSDAESAKRRRSLRIEAARTRLTACEARWVHVSKANSLSGVSLRPQELKWNATAD